MIFISTLPITCFCSPPDPHVPRAPPAAKQRKHSPTQHLQTYTCTSDHSAKHFLGLFGGNVATRAQIHGHQ